MKCQTCRTPEALIEAIMAVQTNWSKVLPFITFCHNSAKSKSLKFSPYFALYGTEPTLPIDVNMKILLQSDLKYSQDYIEDARNLISENLRDAQMK